MAKKWGKLRYVEICSGPGRCCTRNCKEQDGTALSIVKNEHFDLLSDALFIDYSTNVIDILAKRIESIGKQVLHQGRPPQGGVTGQGEDWMELKDGGK